MMRSRWLVVGVVTLFLLMGFFNEAHSQEGSPTTNLPPVPPPDLISTTDSNPPTSLPSSNSSIGPSPVMKLPALKAVLIVGPIDGDNGKETGQAKTDMELAAKELEKNGVQVYRFYTPDNDWGQIAAASRGTHFLFYRGHGISWTPFPTPDVGGLALKDQIVSSDQIRSDIHLAHNAIVMLYGCFAAGSSSSDKVAISSKEAQRRVGMYSDPFFDIGAGAYFADWFGDAFQQYVRYLFEGRTLGQAYEAYYDFNGETVKRLGHPNHPNLAMWLDKDEWYDPKPQYNNAFVGTPGETLEDLFRTGGAKLNIKPSIFLPMLVN